MRHHISMSKVDKILKKMRQNPKSDWVMHDIEVVAVHFGLLLRSPSGGSSHVKVKDPRSGKSITVPAKRPIKPVYIGLLLEFLEEHGYEI